MDESICIIYLNRKKRRFYYIDEKQYASVKERILSSKYDSTNFTNYLVYEGNGEVLYKIYTEHAHKLIYRTLVFQGYSEDKRGAHRVR